MKQLLILCLAALSLTAVAQPVSHYFIQMPAELIPGISLDTRKDLIDFSKNGKLSVMPAAFDGKVQLKTLGEDYLMLQTSESAELQIKVIRLNDSIRVLALVHTVAGPLKDSRMRFYTSTWKPLNEWRLPPFALNDFIDAKKAEELGLTDRLHEIGPRLFVAITFRQYENAFVAVSSLKEDMDKAQSKTLGALVRDSVVYRWNKQGFQAE